MAKSSIPMALTWLRILIAPLVVAVVLLQPSHWNWISAILFVIASITDWFDGHLARKWDSTSTWGKFLDPVADKVLVSSVLILLVALTRLEALAVILLVNRDTFIGGLRSLAASEGLIIAADQLGKWKTGVQMIAIPLALVGGTPFDIPFQSLSYWGLWLSVGLSLFSGGNYFIKYLRQRKHLAVST